MGLINKYNVIRRYIFGSQNIPNTANVMATTTLIEDCTSGDPNAADNPTKSDPIVMAMDRRTNLGWACK